MISKDFNSSPERNSNIQPLNKAAMHTLNTGIGAWSNRQGTWPLSERRMIFASKKEIISE